MGKKSAILLWLAACTAIVTAQDVPNDILGMEMCAQFIGEVQVPHPTQCNQFFICANGLGFIMTCPVGQNFDVRILQCNIQEEAICWADLATPPTVGPGDPTPAPTPAETPAEVPTTPEGEVPTTAPPSEEPSPGPTTLPPSAPTEANTPTTAAPPTEGPGIPTAPTPGPSPAPEAPTPAPTTAAPVTTTEAPTTTAEPTTTTPIPTAPTPAPTLPTEAPVTTTEAPVTTTEAPVTTTAAPITTTAAPITTLPPPPPPPTTTLPPPTGGPTIDCPVNALFYAPHPDCTRFFRCVFGTVFVLDCPPNQHWNQAREYCDHIWNVPCTPSPQG